MRYPSKFLSAFGKLQKFYDFVGMKMLNSIVSKLATTCKGVDKKYPRNRIDCSSRNAKKSGGGHGGGMLKARHLRIMSFLVFPVIFAVGYFVITDMAAEHKNRPEFTKYEYMRKRDKKFPWGDGERSFFHNPEMNALPDGYEADKIEEK